MTRPFKPRLKTLSQLAPGRARKIDRHIHQFQIACLELERTRRFNELAAAQARVEGLNQRLAEIDAEIELRRRDMAPLPALPQAAAPTQAQPPTPAPAGPRQPPPNASNRAPRQTLRY